MPGDERRAGDTDGRSSDYDVHDMLSARAQYLHAVSSESAPPQRRPETPSDGLDGSAGVARRYAIQR
jgi:hypothetical protein